MQIDDDALRSPVRTPETEDFWNAANQQTLLFADCRDCGTPHYYPRRICPFCFSDRVDWKQASGLGRIYAFSLFRRGSPPYVSAWVTLDEGVSMLTNITECDADLLRIGDRVEVVYRPAPDGQLIPLFKPASTVS
ncbi:MAG: OB-fold domain-containing protein [Alphaproteobacteria bacterium]|nr:OB-fold domain-containing protein [Alphaproteobacteria bacterium]